MKTIIFDFDGTIADTLPVIFDAFKKVFKTYENKDLSSEDVKAMFGLAEEEMIRVNFSSKERVEEAIETLFHHYEEQHDTLVERSSAMEELLKFIQSKEIKLAVFTGKGRRGLDISLAKLNLASYFDVAITGDDVEHPKPHPEGLYKILDLLDTPKEEAMMIGDSNADIEAGKSAGVTTVAVQWLSHFQSDTYTTDPDHQFKDIYQFQQYLEKVL
ncbi:HAD family hydrolase [Aquibacillus albus]|uniref:HAD superfamily hydrolase (TIGR01509 family) n=1 Tax=Aquibacillus albus TaxID=1168171 RepID=A0ABS2N5S8_9BACI|nr:HAD-IA family hydrolase [Aquibacillus albus]MBM7573479.1 HAD superfamily hydrolase (TIGR01509 family) [Aquibacillus albus]